MVVRTLKTWHTDKKGRVSLREGVQRALVDKSGTITTKGLTTLVGSVNSPIWHRSVDLGIKEFKRYLKSVPMLSKSQYSEAVTLYKKKAWTDFAETINFKGSFPAVRI